MSTSFPKRWLWLLISPLLAAVAFFLITLPFGSSLTAPAAHAQTEYVDLSTWGQVGEGAGGWQVNGSGTSVTQTVYSEPPSGFVSPDEYSNVIIRGKLQVSSASQDNDLIGFILGFRQVETEIVWGVLFDWKRATQELCGYTSQEGFTLFQANTEITPAPGFCPGETNNQVNNAYWKYLWGHEQSPSIRRLATDYGSNGWSYDTEYNFEIWYLSQRVRIVINGDRIFDVSGDFPAGRVGFYDFSQADTQFYDVTLQPVSRVYLPFVH
jgi:hypothetical protein